MTLLPVVILLDTLTPSGDMGDGDDLTLVETSAAASSASAETPMESLGLSLATGATISGVVLRARATASADGFSPLWSAGAERIRWRVSGGTIAEENPPTDIPKTGAFAWVQTSVLTTDPDGDPWTAAAINGLEVAVKVGWNASAMGAASVFLSEVRAVVYAETQADAHVVAVGVGEPVAAWVGNGTPRAVAVGAGTPRTAWVGEEE